MSRAALRALRRAEAKHKLWEEMFRIPLRRHLEQILDDVEVETVEQEVWTIVWKHALDGGPMTLTWLFRTADNVIRNEVKRANARERVQWALEVRLSSAPPPTDQLDAIALHDAMSTLSERDRRYLTLFYWDQLSAGEIAGMYGKSQAAVRQSIKRARDTLRTLLTEEGSRERLDS